MSKKKSDDVQDVYSLLNVKIKNLNNQQAKDLLEEIAGHIEAMIEGIESDMEAQS